MIPLTNVSDFKVTQCGVTVNDNIDVASEQENSKGELEAPLYFLPRLLAGIFLTAFVGAFCITSVIVKLMAQHESVSVHADVIKTDQQANETVRH